MSQTDRRAAAWSYRPELDGLRTFAVVIIIFFHARVAGASSSFIALDLFFVLSGFLVTNVVLAEVDETGRLDVGRYYARRVRRLLPAAVAVILITCVVFVLVSSKPERLEFVRQAQAALVYLANWQFIADSFDYFAADPTNSPFMHFWSLSIEEQYYIFFPLMVVAVLKFAPGRQRVLLTVMGVLIVASLAAQVYWAQIDANRAYYGTDTRLFQLLAGAVIAVAMREFVVRGRTEHGVVWPVLGRVLAVSGLAGYAIFGLELIDMSVSNRNILATFLAAALVVGLYTAQGSLLARIFSLPLMVYFGKISYGIYLWHWPSILVVQHLFAVRPLVVAVIAGTMATALAALSYEVLETPIRRGRRLNAFHWPVVGVGVTTSVLVALLVINPVLSSDRAPVAATLAGSAADNGVVLDASESDRLSETPPPDLDYREIRRDRGIEFHVCRSGAVEECVLVDNPGPHLVLVGDSHARMLVPAVTALAEERGYKLSVNISPGCPWQDGLINTRGDADREQRCRDARIGFYDETLEEMGADLVIASALQRSDESWQKAIKDEVAERDESLSQRQLRATERTVRKIRKAGASLLIVKSIGGTNGWANKSEDDPLDCLARAESLSDCVVSWPQDRPPIDSNYDTIAVQNDDVSTVDLNPLACPAAPLCLPVIEGIPVWRDAVHLTIDYVEHITPGILALIDDSGALTGLTS